MKKILLTFSILTISILYANSQTLINSGFENWDVDSSSGTPIWNPTDWFAFNMGLTDPDAVSKSTDFHSGKYSAKIIPTTFFGIPFPGILEYNNATTQKLKYLNGFYKSKLTATDTFMIAVNYSNSGTGENYTLGQMASGSKTAWTPFNIQIDLPTAFTPDSFTVSVIVMGSGSPSGMLDDLSFSNTPSGNAFGKVLSASVRGIKKTANLNQTLYPNPANTSANLDYFISKPGKVRVVISNLLGKVVKNITTNEILLGQQHLTINTEDMQSGVYFYTIQTSTGTVTKKFVVSH